MAVLKISENSITDLNGIYLPNNVKPGYYYTSSKTGYKYGIFRYSIPEINSKDLVWIIARCDCKEWIYYYYSTSNPIKSKTNIPPLLSSLWINLASHKESFKLSIIDENEDEESENKNESKNKKDMKKGWILVTGGTGFIGSHTIVELYNAGFKNIIIIDNYANSSPIVLERLKAITNIDYICYNIDLASNVQDLEYICQKYEFLACIHFAGLKAVGESVEKPLLYYYNNLLSTINLLNILPKYKCNNFIFSSSATVYGNSGENIAEISPVPNIEKGGITNPYGKTKYFNEEILKDFAKANNQSKVIILRYFNPIGAHSSGLIGEDPDGIPNNLMPYLLQVAIGRRTHLNLFGNDWPTKDGTGVRDYIHVVDIAKGHVAALKNDIILQIQKEEEQQLQNGYDKLNQEKNNNNNNNNNVSIYNLGTGKPVSVLELIHALEKASNKKIPYKIATRRDGDVAILTADCLHANKKLKWIAQKNIDDCCKDAWNWQSKNPMGFRTQK